MLYDCVNCGHGIAREARRCPYCGTEDAGYRAICAHGARSYYSQPDWREQAAAKAAKEKAASDQTWYLWLIFMFIGAVLGSWFLASVTGGVIGGVIGMILGGFAGFLAGGLAIVIFFD
jgi:hypothetical protein